MYQPLSRGCTNLSQYMQQSVSHDRVFVYYLFAVMEVYQLDPLAMGEWASWCGLPELPTIRLKFTPAETVKYSSCRLQRLLSLHQQDMTLALVDYYGGTTALTSWINDSIVRKDIVDYMYEVHSVHRVCGKVTEGTHSD